VSLSIKEETSSKGEYKLGEGS